MIVALAGVAGCGSGGAEGDPSASTAAATGDSGTSSTESKSGKPAQDPLHPIVVLETSLGKVKVQLDAEKARLTVDNFLRYVETGFYDQTIFHQAVAGDIVLGGAYAPDLTEKKADVPIRNEAHNGLKNARGTIAMVRRPDAIDSATCQFFFNLADNPRLDHQGRTEQEYGYCVFGRVVEGMEVVDKLGQVKVEDTTDFVRKPVETVMIKAARRIR
jgi:cyclophilin family peptidyl-prolyl cis-trans isomerase